MYVHAHMYMFVGIRMCTCMYSPRTTWGHHPQEHYPCPMRQGLPPAWSSPFKLNCWPVGLRDSSVSAFSVLGLQSHATMPGFFIRILGIKVRSLCQSPHPRGGFLFSHFEFSNPCVGFLKTEANSHAYSFSAPLST